MIGLTAKQRQIVDYIKQYIEIHHYSPSLEEIRKHFAYSSIYTIHEHLVALKKKQASTAYISFILLIISFKMRPSINNQIKYIFFVVIIEACTKIKLI